MNAKVIVAIVLLVVAAVIVAVKMGGSSEPQLTDDQLMDMNLQESDPDAVTVPDGRVPDMDAEFECTVDDVYMDGKHETLRFSVREVHGWWVNKNSVLVQFWRLVEDPDTGDMVAPEKKSDHLIIQPIPFNKPVSEAITVIAWQDHPDTDLGTAEDWECEVSRWTQRNVVAPRE